MTARINSAAAVGFDGRLIEVECDASRGLPSLQIVGLGNKAIDEAKERVRSAIKNSHLEFPAKRITINLAPANLPKDGAHFDLPIALAILIVSGKIKQSEVENSLFVGELSLDGDLRSVRGSIAFAETARNSGITKLYLPIENARQAAIISGVDVYGVKNIAELFLHLKNEKVLQPITLVPKTSDTTRLSTTSLDDIHGQEQAKRALTIAAAGHHNILFTGPPGAGKTMLAKALISLLPPLEISEQIEVTKLHSLAGEAEDGVLVNRPLRSPHHSSSHISLIGGGKNPRPGEISLAHYGVLFLDELPEYSRASLESLRQPLEDGVVNIARANDRVTYPASFMLVATQNPCPCGYYGDSLQECTCSPYHILSYQKRISGPLLDRIDMIVKVGRVEHKQLLSKEVSVDNANSVKSHILAARTLQKNRYQSESLTNAKLSSKQIGSYLTLMPKVKSLLDNAAAQLKLSSRAYFKVIKVAQSIADLEDAPQIDAKHITEALQYRLKR